MRVVAKPDVHTLDAPVLHQNLSAGTRYFVLGVSDGYYRLINDTGEPILYPKKLFEIQDTSIPADWVFEQFEDDAYNLCPRGLNERGFYEDIFNSDGDVVVRDRCRAHLRSVLTKHLEHASEIDKALIERDLLSYQELEGEQRR